MRKLFGLAALLGLALGAAQPATAQITQPNQKLIVAMDVGFAPFAYRDAKGVTQGFTVDFAEAIAKKLGRPGAEIVDQPYAGIFAGLFAKRYDFVIAPTNITPERAQQMLFTEPYMPTGLGFLVRQGDRIDVLEDLKGKVISVNSGSISDTWLTENATKYGFEVQRYSKNADAVQAVGTKRAFANVADVPVTYYVAAQQKRQFRVGYELFTGRSFGLPFRLEDVAFRNQVETIVEGMKKDGSLSKIHEKWFGRPAPADSTMTNTFPGFGAPGFNGYTGG